MSTTDPKPERAAPRPVPRTVVLGGVIAAAVICLVGAGLVAWNAWRVGFEHGHTRIEAAVSGYTVLALLATALAALPFTFLQWVDPEQKQRWRTAGGAVGLVGCGLFLLLWITG